MSAWQELYQQMIVDHGRHPRNFNVLENATCQKKGVNPLCGDQLTVYLQVEKGQVKGVSFEGTGCAISMASASLMTEAIKGQPVDDVLALFEQFQQAVTEPKETPPEGLGKLAVLTGVAAYPMRVKCATLAWHALKSALTGGDTAVSTET